MRKRICMGKIDATGKLTDEEMLDETAYQIGRELVTNPQKYGVYINFVNDQFSFSRRVTVELTVYVPKPE